MAVARVVVLGAVQEAAVGVLAAVQVAAVLAAVEASLGEAAMVDSVAE